MSQTIDLTVCVVWSMLQAVSECIRQFGSGRESLWTCLPKRHIKYYKSEEKSPFCRISAAPEWDFLIRSPKQLACLDLIVEVRSRSRSIAISQTLDLNACFVWSVVQAVSECICKFGLDHTYGIDRLCETTQITNPKINQEFVVKVCILTSTGAASECDFTENTCAQVHVNMSVLCGPN